MQNKRIKFHDTALGAQGRRRFTLFWDEPDGVWCKEESPQGGPVGYRRAQEFNANPAPYLEGAEILDSEPSSDAKRAKLINDERAWLRTLGLTNRKVF